MRITTGKYHNRKLHMPRGIRPTQDKVRKAIFDILGDVEGLSFLELYAGSGAVGFEGQDVRRDDPRQQKRRPEPLCDRPEPGPPGEGIGRPERLPPAGRQIAWKPGCNAAAVVSHQPGSSQLGPPPRPPPPLSPRDKTVGASSGRERGCRASSTLFLRQQAPYPRNACLPASLPPCLQASLPRLRAPHSARPHGWQFGWHTHGEGGTKLGFTVIFLPAPI